MLRRLIGFAVLAIVALLLLKVLMGGLALLAGLAIAALWLAGLGFFMYLALRLFSPRTADALIEVITGGQAAPLPAIPGTMIGQFLPQADVSECHELWIAAPADVVMQTIRQIDMQALPGIAAIVRLRAWLLGARAPRPRPVARGLVAETSAMGWACLAERPGFEYVAGAVTQPWLADVTFRPIPSAEFASWAEPGFVKIAWSLEVEPISNGRSVFRTQTRAVATDLTARKRFLRYWRLVGPGVVLIRHLLLRELRREAERRGQHGGPAEPPLGAGKTPLKGSFT